MPYRASLRLTGSPAVWGGGPPLHTPAHAPPRGCCGCAELPAGEGSPGPGSSLSREHPGQAGRSAEAQSMRHVGGGAAVSGGRAGGLGSRGPPPRDTTCPLHLRPELGPAVPSRQHVLTFLRDRHRVLMTVHRTSSGGQGPPSELWLPAQPLGQGGVCRGSPARRRAQDPAPRLSGWLLLAGAISPI